MARKGGKKGRNNNNNNKNAGNKKKKLEPLDLNSSPNTTENDNNSSESPLEEAVTSPENAIPVCRAPYH